MSERGLWRPGMKKPEAVAVTKGEGEGKRKLIIEQCHDFASETCIIERIIRERGHIFLLLPKYHCTVS